jgi:glc operon protein GlcG
MIRLARSLTLVCFALVGVSTAGAQVADQKTLSLEGARTIADAAAAEAHKHNAGGAIAVVDNGGHLVFLARLDKTFPAASAVAIEKARTAATFRRPTRDFENAIKSGRTSLLGVSVMTPLQGGVPIVVDGEVVGAVGVSGATSAQEDDDIATVAAAALHPTASSSAQQ